MRAVSARQAAAEVGSLRLRRVSRRRHRAAMLLMAWVHACALGSEKFPEALVGVWEVTRVAVDLADQPHWLYVPDDPRLLNRELRITASGLSIDTGERPCKAVAWRPEIRSLRALIGESFVRPPRFDTPVHPTLADFALEASLEKMTAHTVKCAEPSDPWSDAWFVVVAQDRLLMRFGSSALLSLKRLPKEHKPVPSFTCGRASNDAERTICGSNSLAGLDRSVAAAYQRALSRDGGLDIEHQQAEWLKARNACATDAPCLAGFMLDRIEELMQK